LVERGIRPGDRVAVMLEPSREFYVSLFGAIKMGAITVPLFTLFGPDGIKLRIEDCRPRLLITNAEKASHVPRQPDLDVLVTDDQFLSDLQHYPDTFESHSRADDLAIFQYTSGTTRELPEAVKHTHRA